MKTRETVGVDTNVHVATYDSDRVRRLIPDWGDLSHRQKSRRLWSIEPDELHSTHNVTTEALTEYHSQDLNPEISEPSITASYLALGDDDTQPLRENEALNNEIERLPYTDAIDRGDELAIVVFLDSSMLNGQSILEGGLVTEDTDGLLLNHSLWADPEGRLNPKTDQVVANLVIELRWGDGG